MLSYILVCSYGALPDELAMSGKGGSSNFFVGLEISIAYFLRFGYYDSFVISSYRLLFLIILRL